MVAVLLLVAGGSDGLRVVASQGSTESVASGGPSPTAAGSTVNPNLKPQLNPNLKPLLKPLSEETQKASSAPTLRENPFLYANPSQEVKLAPTAASNLPSEPTSHSRRSTYNNNLYGNQLGNAPRKTEYQIYNRNQMNLRPEQIFPKSSSSQKRRRFRPVVSFQQASYVEDDSPWLVIHQESNGRVPKLDTPQTATDTDGRPAGAVNFYADNHSENHHLSKLDKRINIFYNDNAEFAPKFKNMNKEEEDRLKIRKLFRHFKLRRS